MPYIEEKLRETALHSPQDAGELNFALTKAVLKYLGDSPSYQDYNDVFGAIECCKQEIYRRRLAVYEDAKILVNGGVF